MVVESDKRTSLLNFAVFSSEKSLMPLGFFIDAKSPIFGLGSAFTGNTNRGERLSTLDLLIEVPCFVKKCE